MSIVNDFVRAEAKKRQPATASAQAEANKETEMGQKKGGQEKKKTAKRQRTKRGLSGELATKANTKQNLLREAKKAEKKVRHLAKRFSLGLERGVRRQTETYDGRITRLVKHADACREQARTL